MRKVYTHFLSLHVIAVSFTCLANLYYCALGSSCRHFFAAAADTFFLLECESSKYLYFFRGRNLGEKLGQEFRKDLFSKNVSSDMILLVLVEFIYAAFSP